MSIYCLRLPDGFFYYGGTKCSLGVRLGHHRRQHKQLQHRKLYQHISSWDEVSIELVEKIDDESKLREREQFYITNNRSNPKCLNQYDAYDTPESRLLKKRERQKKRRSELTDEEKERRRLRHNELQKIRRAK